MRKVIEENERLKRKNGFHLEESVGLGVKYRVKVLAAISKFEQSNGLKPFKRFHIRALSENLGLTKFSRIKEHFDSNQYDSNFRMTLWRDVMIKMMDFLVRTKPRYPV